MENNMADIQEQITDVIALPSDQRQAIYQVWAKSSDKNQQEKCFLLSVRMRKDGMKQEAFSASQYLTQNNPSLKSYNIYLASAYDLTIGKELSIDVLEEIFIDAFDFYIEMDFEPNITATLLKVCNHLIPLGKSDVDKFNRIYQKCPDEYRQNNTFIAAQYLKRLIIDKKERDALQAFENMSINVRTHRSIVQIMKQCDSRFSTKKPTQNQSANEAQAKRITLISDNELLDNLAELLSAFSFDLQLVNIEYEGLLERLNQRTYKSIMALVVLSKRRMETDKVKANWLFALGYCAHKFSKNNILVFVKDLTEYADPVMEPFFNLISAINYSDDVEILTELGRRNIIAG